MGYTKSNITMKKLMTIFLSILLIMGLLNTGCKTKNLTLFAGCFTEGDEKGLSVFEMNVKTGKLEKLSENAVGNNPSYLIATKEHKLIYALNEVMEFNGETGAGITTLQYNAENGEIIKKNEIVVPYGGACHFSLTHDRKYLLVASYASGSAAVVRLDNNGIPKSVTDTLLFEPEGAKVSHAHMISQDPAGRHVYLTDLGLDRIMIYDLDTARGRLELINDGKITLPDGTGPRHFVFSKDGSVMYVINELGSTIMVFDVASDGRLNIKQTLSTVGEDYRGTNACAEILIGKDGRFLYGSNRGENTIVVYKINDNQQLTFAGRVSCGGDWPRSFMIDPAGEFLLVGNQKSNNIAVFRINKNTGIPEGPVENTAMKAPTYLEFWNQR
jgi:6-phosphogluconolactonase